MALNFPSILASSPSSSSSPTLCLHHFRNQQLFKVTKALETSSTASFSLRLNATPAPDSSTSSIFLHFLQEEDEEQNPERRPQEREQGEDLDSISDPILKFFKTRSANPKPDPKGQGRFTLQPNRRTSWHLAPNLRSMKDEEGDLLDEEVDNSQPGDFPANSAQFAKEGVVDEILEKARSLPENLTLGEVLEGFERRVGKEECVEVLELMGQEGLITGCLYLFEWMRSNEPSLLSPRACSVLFPLLGRKGMGEELMILVRNLPVQKEFRDVRVYNASISGLSYCRRYADAWELFESMKACDVKPDHVTCAIMITIMRKEGRSAKDAWEFFERMSMEGVQWSLELVGALIKLFCDEGLKKEALIIQSEMEQRGISPNAIIYNTIIDAYSKSNQIEEAEGLFAEMKAKGVLPTSATYNILMDAYSKRTEPEIVEKLMLEMKNDGLEPNVNSYTCLISAYGRQKKMSDRAADAFLRMKKAGIKPTPHSYTALIHAYSLDGWHEKAYISFENMEKDGLKPSIQTYTALLDAFRRAGDTKTLMRIWKMMVRDKIEGTRVTFNTLLDGFAKQGQYIEARDVICEFGKIGLQPTVMTYNMLMNAYARGGQESKLPQLLNEMKSLNLKPDSITYTTMIYAYFRVRDFKRAFYYHKQMVKSGQIPDPRSYKKLRDLLDEKAAIKNRKDKSALLGIVKSSMGLLKQKKKGKKDEFWKNKKKHPRTHASTPARRYHQEK